jgi:hypothetical protein
MEVSEQNSVLSTNNAFYKSLKVINDKKLNKESTAKEIEWIQSQILNENPKICENSVNILILSCDYGFALNSLVSALPRVSSGCYEILADGIFKLLLNDVGKKDYKCPFDIQKKPHPLLLLIQDSSEKMMYLSRRVVGVLRNSNR